MEASLDRLHSVPSFHAFFFSKLRLGTMLLIQDHRFIPKSTQFPTSHYPSFKITSSLPQFKPKDFPNSHKWQLYAEKINPISHALHENLQTCIGFCLSIALVSFPPPSISAETTESSGDKINIDAIVASIDDFFNRNPFFVASLAFIYFLVIPLLQVYFRKYKPIKAIDAFSKLRDVPEVQLLDIRKEKSVKFMASPNLKIFNKNTVWVEYEEGEEDDFVKKVLENFAEPANTVLCILDSFDGDSLKVAELLHKNGFKETYAIKGGVRGKDGWLAIQEECFPPSVRISRRKRKLAMSSQLQINGVATSNDVSKTNEDNPLGSSSSTSKDELSNGLP